MTPEMWARVEALLDRAMSLPPEKRDELLRQQSDSADVIDHVRRLLRNHEMMESGFLAPPDAVAALHRAEPPVLQPGELLANRFDIRRFIGSGGMGQVYEAYDVESRETLALKILHPSSQNDPDALLRFRRELPTARRVTHQNVCRVYDIQSDIRPGGRILFLTMELLPGETLAARLRRDNRLQPAEFASIFRQIAAGLQAAHQALVVHRDLKPGNIMLEPDGRVVLMDFGLARADHQLNDGALRTITRTGEVFGTFDYMAPEQLRGEEATLRTDLYALGLIAYEALTGARAFAGGTPVESASRKLNSQAPSARELVPGLPNSWDRLIRTCLERDPSRRPPSALAAISQLESGGSGISRHAGWSTARISRRVAISTAAVVSSLAAGYRLYEWGRKPLAHQGVGVLAPPASAADPALEQAVRLQMRKSLGQSDYLKLWDLQRLPAVLQRMGRTGDRRLTAREWREVALRESVPFVLFTSVVPLSDGYSIGVSLEQVGAKPDEPARQWRKDFSAPAEDRLLARIDEAGRWARDLLGESSGAVTQSSVPALEVTTNSWAALMEFSRGERLAQSRDSEGAILAYDEAVRRDPDFTMAWMRRGDVEVSLGREQEGLAAYFKALATSKSRPLTRKEDLRFRSMFYTDIGDFESAARTFRDYRQYYPSDPYGYFFAAHPLMMLGYADEAIGVLKECLRFPERKPYALLHLAWAYVYQGDRASAEAQAEMLSSLGLAPHAAYARSCIAYTFGDTASALTQLATAGPLRAGARTFYSALALADGGRLAEAAGILERSAEVHGSKELGTLQMLELTSLAYLRHDLGQTKGALDALHAALQHPVGPRNAVQIGALLARLGQTPKAEELLRGLPSTFDCPYYDLARLRLQGEILLQKGGAKQAVAIFEKAAALDVRCHGQHYLAFAYEHAGRAQDARIEYQRSLKQKSFQLQLVTPEPAGTWLRTVKSIEKLKSV